MSMTTAHGYTGRFAPSPSGLLHFGSLVAALGSYLDARVRHGRWLMRIEDLDPPREKPGAADEILRTLDAFGFEWDGEVLYQSRRIEAYHAALARLEQAGLAYPCTCSRRQVAAANLIGLEGPIYPGTCRNRRAGIPIRHAVRLNTQSSTIVFSDRLAGEISQHVEREVGDFVIRRLDGLFAYQLAVVVDDAYQGVTDVVRGADLLTSTPRQILLQQHLQLPVPAYAHLPLVMGQDGRKLSKQDQAHPVDRVNPLPCLLQAYGFLGQRLPDGGLESVAEFWKFALNNWRIEWCPGPGSNRHGVAPEGF